VVLNKIGELENELNSLKEVSKKTKIDLQNYIEGQLSDVKNKVKEVDDAAIYNLNQYVKQFIDEIKSANDSYVEKLTEKNYININNDDKRTAYERFTEALPTKNFPLLLMLLKKMTGQEKKKAFASLINFYPKELREIKKFL